MSSFSVSADEQRGAMRHSIWRQIISESCLTVIRVWGWGWGGCMCLRAGEESEGCHLLFPLIFYHFQKVEDDTKPVLSNIVSCLCKRGILFYFPFYPALIAENVSK